MMKDMYKTSVYGVCEEEMRYDDRFSCFWDYILPFTRFWGVLSAIVMCGVGVDIAFHQHKIGLFYIVCSMVVLFLEITWAITLFLQVCVRNEFSPFLSCWGRVLWFGLWKRSVLYIIFATILFLRPHRLWLSILSGVQLLSLAALYLILTYRSCRHSKMPPAPRLLHSHSPSQEENYDKYDDINEVLDDSLPTPLITDNLSELEQDTILEI